MNAKYAELPSLKALLEEPAYIRLKNLFLQRRTAFKNNPNAAIDLAAYERCDNNHNYTVLKGLIPESLVGKASAGAQIAWGKSETFFTDFIRHYPESFVLSATNDSLIIGNRESHDIRQYLAEFDPGFKDKTASAGMSYLHFLAIPRRKGRSLIASPPFTVYNVVALDDTELVEEMIAHFHKFWAAPGSVERSIDRIQMAVDLRAKDIIKGFQENIETAPQRTAQFEDAMTDVQRATNEFADELRRWEFTDGDFFFGFHAAPDASVGHLHMHIVLAPSEFRKYSTGVHDWKTIPANAVVEVIHQENKDS